MDVHFQKIYPSADGHAGCFRLGVFGARVFFVYWRVNTIKLFVKQYKTLHSCIDPRLENSVCCHKDDYRRSYSVQLKYVMTWFGDLKSSKMLILLVVSKVLT